MYLFVKFFFFLVFFFWVFFLFVFFCTSTSLLLVTHVWVDVWFDVFVVLIMIFFFKLTTYYTFSIVWQLRAYLCWVSIKADAMLLLQHYMVYVSVCCVLCAVCCVLCAVCCVLCVKIFRIRRSFHRNMGTIQCHLCTNTLQKLRNLRKFNLQFFIAHALWSRKCLASGIFYTSFNLLYFFFFFLFIPSISLLMQSCIFFHPPFSTLVHLSTSPSFLSFLSPRPSLKIK
jgi:hypothetical protein